jgi:hypothetical protein
MVEIAGSIFLGWVSGRVLVAMAISTFHFFAPPPLAPPAKALGAKGAKRFWAVFFSEYLGM